VKAEAERMTRAGLEALAEARAGQDTLKAAEDAIKALREAKDPAAKKRAAEALEKATRKVLEQAKGAAPRE
jgi:hypothetical protein